MNRYVVIGNGTAAVGCIEGIRSVDKDGGITVISEENHKVYSRPLISYYLENKTNLEHMKYRDDDFYERNNCTLLLGCRAASVDKNEKTVTTDEGKKIPYDRLCIAAGSSPFVPPFKGLETVKNKTTFLTLDDALTLEEMLDAFENKARVLIVGAGLIGLKCAEGIAERTESITVCDLADRVLSSILDNDCAAFVRNRLEQKGIKFLLGDTAESFDENKANMKSGETVPFDILVLAVGVRANTELVKAAGGNVNRGIIVDTEMRTSLEDVYAAGDCSEGYDASIDSNRVLAILPNAYMQGYAAGKNMAGEETKLENLIPMNSIGFFGLHMMTAGAYEGELFEEKTEDMMKRFFVKDGLLKGFILIGDVERAGIYTSLIREKIPLDSIDFELAKKTAANLIYDKNVRQKKFGGVV